MNFKFTSEVEVSRTGCHQHRPASGKTTIEWELCLEMNPAGIVGFKLAATSKILELELESWNDELDKQDEWQETLDLSEIVVKIESLSSLKLTDGLFPKELRVWGTQVSLVF